MIKAYLRRAWSVGRTYYLITLMVLLLAPCLWPLSLIT